MSDLNNTLSLPMKLDAFIFNPSVSSGGPNPDDRRAKIAPITQPNYTFLRLHDALIQGDILPHTDIHNAFENSYNSRFCDIDTGEEYKDRQGVYLHWMLPRLYRVGVAAAGDGATLDPGQEGLPPREGADTDVSAPQFRAVPTRWLVIRRLKKSEPDFKGVGVPEYQAWVIESDKGTGMANLTEENYPHGVPNVQTDFSPFITAPDDNSPINIEEQAEALIGGKTPVDKWTEDPESNNRPLLTVMHGGNMLFADFQQHNTNVFSMIDNFEYGDADDLKCLESATADYYVIGWHADESQDPLYISDMAKVDRNDRIQRSQLKLDDNSKDGQTWSASSESGNTLSHGAMYNVEWSATDRPANIPADTLSEHLHDLDPIAVGSTPLDALLAYVKASQESEQDQDVKQVMHAVECIQKYFLMDEDTVDSHEQAEDLLYSFNFDNFPGGTRWHVAEGTDPQKPTARPDPGIIESLNRLNQQQTRLDSLSRLEDRIKWEVFAIWWGFVTRRVSNSKGDTTVKDTKSKVDAWTTKKDKLLKQLNKCKQDRDDIVEKDPALAQLITDKIVCASVHPNFHTQTDPTLLVGHMESSWPSDWLELLLARVNTDITTWETRDESTDVHLAVGLDKLPESIRDTAAALVNEFISLSVDIIKPIRPFAQTTEAEPAQTILPLYHDLEIKNEEVQRDRWGSTQPFFPLFLEWEAEYAHIDIEQWSLKERSFTGQQSAKLSYGMATDDPLYNRKEWTKERDTQDIRLLSGRMLILPQAAFSLQAQVDAVISQTPPDELKKALGDIPVDELKDNLSKLAFLSTPLSGFHDHLLTMNQGTHITPTIRQPGGTLKIIKEATNRDAGLEEDILTYLGTETDVTPYATLVSLSTKIEESPFKPVTHGQFKFTKINIVDKFGQVVHALDPRWDATPQTIRPCLSDFFAPDPNNVDGGPNIVEESRGGEGGSAYAQIPPHINQMARLNSTFVKRLDNGDWVPQQEWDNPIWGWVVFNYLDRAIQFFLQDGTFYREVRIGGEAGVSKSEKWLPFKNSDKKPDDFNQLDYLIEKMATVDKYLDAMLFMIGGAMDYADTAPDAYAQFLNSIIGRPLALVNMAWSLELGTDELTNQSDLVKKDPKRSLLPETRKPGHANDPLYTFPIKMGDKNRSYDGLVGYFKTKEAAKQTQASYLDLDNCYTFFGLDKMQQELEDQPDDKKTAPLVKIDQNNYPILEPFHPDPVNNDAFTMEIIRNRMLAKNTFGAIIDPFRPVHGYTSILPIQPLKVPEWTWQEAMSRMTAFFHFGPLTVIQNVPDYDPDYLLTTKTDIKDDKKIIAKGAGLPTMGTADWAWLQPYRGEGGDAVHAVGVGRGGYEADIAEWAVYLY
ncbi:unnamed protein product [Clonostachys solani]|uniref:Uncharacterized protein n=1 Tax=Clonostachys solani TaxID=160281 RepID=A0A9P0ECP7_9HYPO|nr:unnamed protein product [Clonostachys solani]